MDLVSSFIGESILPAAAVDDHDLVADLRSAFLGLHSGSDHFQGRTAGTFIPLAADNRGQAQADYRVGGIGYNILFTSSHNTAATDHHRWRTRR